MRVHGRCGRPDLRLELILGRRIVAAFAQLGQQYRVQARQPHEIRGESEVTFRREPVGHLEDVRDQPQISWMTSTAPRAGPDGSAWYA
ncbi:hypothetical protein [Arthrobacter polaris]|uniref:hypothetical protein n=1 Tax=Arthrobacter polaris TaxID=2813727 RepID=UPI001F2FC5F7|nr:hypothetical protein [Arthrobacter polaris]UIK88068.1 hypothetical protein J0916_11485 [Arthrobacter polaris]